MSQIQRQAESLAGDELIDHYIRVETPSHADAISLLGYWRICMAKGDGFVVGRDIPARAISRILRSVILFEPLASETDLKVRLAGADVRRRFDSDLKGRLMSQMFSAADFAVHRKSAFEVIGNGVPIILDTSLKRGIVEELRTEVLLLPVTARDGKSTWLLATLFYYN
jgi:hypothetical protein